MSFDEIVGVIKNLFDSFAVKNRLRIINNPNGSHEITWAYSSGKIGLQIVVDIRDFLFTYSYLGQMVIQFL